MPKVVGPALSLSAQGKFGNTVQFQKNPAGHVLYKKHKPGDRVQKEPSDLQVSKRYIYKLASIRWQVLTDEEKQEWNNLAESQGNKMSGWNLYYKKVTKDRETYLGIKGYWDFTRENGYDYTGNGNNATIQLGSGEINKLGLICAGNTKASINNIDIEENNAFFLVFRNSLGTNMIGKVGTYQVTRASNKHIYYIRSENGTWYAIGSGNIYKNNEDQILCMRKEDGGINIMEDGIISGIKSFVGNVDNTTNELAFGAYGGSYFTGILKAGILFKRYVENEEMLKIYKWLKLKYKV